VVFQADYAEIELQKSVMASFQSRHRHCIIEKYVTKITSQNFSILGPPLSKFLATPV